MADDIWESFSDEELLELLKYLEFIKNVSPVEMPYYFLQRRLKLYLFSERKIRADIKSPFQFKHNHIFNSLDNDILIDCLSAIQAKISLTIEKDGGKDTITALPIKVIHDTTYGRQYLMFYNITRQQVNGIRIDHIKKVQAGGPLTPIMMSASSKSNNSVILFIVPPFIDNGCKHILEKVAGEGNVSFPFQLKRRTGNQSFF